ncbi:hypothetical protein IWZ01DRAFT_543600 [Phyllosticta capitalensis]
MGFSLRLQAVCDHNQNHTASASASTTPPGAFDLGEGFDDFFESFDHHHLPDDFNASSLFGNTTTSHLAHNNITLPAVSSGQAPSSCTTTQQPSDLGLFNYFDLDLSHVLTPSTSSSDSELGLGTCTTTAHPAALISAFPPIPGLDLSSGGGAVSLDSSGLSFDGLGAFTTTAPATAAPESIQAPALLPPASASTTLAPPSTASSTIATSTPAAAAPLPSFSPATTYSQESLTPPVAPPAASTSSTMPQQTQKNSTKRSRDSTSPPSASLIEKRARNSVAARKCRQKKLDRIDMLEQALAAMTAERDELRVRMARMEGEMMGLKKAREGA